MSEFEVKLRIYDLSMGMAKQLSMQFTGQQVRSCRHIRPIALFILKNDFLSYLAPARQAPFN